MTSAAQSIEVPAGECYVAVVPKPPGRITDRVAAFAAEGQLPRPIDALCIAWRAAGDQLVVVAVDHERADRWLSEGVLAARISSLPPELEIHTPQIELLRNAHLPPKIRKHRHRRIVGLAMVVTIGCLAAAYGLHQRRTSLVAQAASADAATIEHARGVLPQWREGQSPQLALTGELRRLRGLASEKRQDQPTDSRVTLAALFEVWPSGDAFQVESIEAAGDRVSLRSMAPSRDAAIALAGVLTEGAPFESALPHVHTETQRDGEVTRIELSLTHSGGDR